MLRSEKYSLNEKVKLIFESPDDDRYWFGYYNYCPIDKSGDKLLAHRWHCDGEERDFNKDDTIDVGWFSIADKKWHYIATTHAANWQQGAMTQWLNIDGEQRIIFNDADDEGKKYISKIYNVDGTLYKTLPMAIYGINEEEGFSITINFERAYWCRAYHYEYIQNEELNKKVTDVDGIYKIDLNNGTIEKIIDIKTIIQASYNDTFKDAKHWVEHIMLSPSGNKFSFYHRFDTGEGFRTRCFIADISGEIVCTLKDWEKTSWSHLGWINDEEFAIFGVKRRVMGNAFSSVTKRSGFGTFLRKCYRTVVAPFVSKQMHNKIAARSHYEIYNCEGEYLGCYEKGLLVIDGHPSFIKDGRYMLTDTYADDNGNRNLVIFDTRTKILNKLAAFHSPINACGFRSDLHPRFANNNKYIVIDSAHTGKHKLLVLSVDVDKL